MYLVLGYLIIIKKFVCFFYISAFVLFLIYVTKTINEYKLSYKFNFIGMLCTTVKIKVKVNLS